MEKLTRYYDGNVFIYLTPDRMFWNYQTVTEKDIKNPFSTMPQVLQDAIALLLCVNAPVSSYLLNAEIRSVGGLSMPKDGDRIAVRVLASFITAWEKEHGFVYNTEIPDAV